MHDVGHGDGGERRQQARLPQYGIAAGDTMFTGREFIQEEEMCRFEVNGVRNYDE